MLRDTKLTNGLNYHLSFTFSFLQRGGNMERRILHLTFAYQAKATGEEETGNRHWTAKARAG